MSGSSQYKFGVLAKIVKYMRSRHQEGEDNPLSLDAPHSTQYTHYSLKHILPQHSNIFNDVFLMIIPQILQL
jgi:hypothetical protein